MSIEITMLLALTTGALGIIAAIVATKKDSKKEGENQGTIFNDIKYLRTSVDEMRLDQREHMRRYEEMNKTVITHDSEIKQLKEESKKAFEHADNAHKRINKFGG